MFSPSSIAPIRPVVLIFIDGLGIGSGDPAVNPLAASGFEVLSLIQRLGLETPFRENIFSGRAIDARLGVAGLPQSGTGQTALLTGINAPARLGRHLNGIPNRTLRAIIGQASIFRQLAGRGLVGNFANAFTPEFFTYYRRKRLSVTTWSTLAGGRPLQTLDDLRHGRAVYQDFTNLMLRQRGYDLPVVTPETAGQVLAGLATRQPFLLYEYFLTDIAGHSGSMAFAGLVLRLLDRMLAALLQTVDLGSTTVLLSSDHGNIEDMGRKPHTLNPVPLLAWGPGAAYFTNAVRSIRDVTPAIIGYFLESAKKVTHSHPNG